MKGSRTPPTKKRENEGTTRMKNSDVTGRNTLKDKQASHVIPVCFFNSASSYCWRCLQCTLVILLALWLWVYLVLTGRVS